MHCTRAVFVLTDSLFLFLRHLLATYYVNKLLLTLSSQIGCALPLLVDEHAGLSFWIIHKLLCSACHCVLQLSHYISHNIQITVVWEIRQETQIDDVWSTLFLLGHEHILAVSFSYGEWNSRRSYSRIPLFSLHPKIVIASTISRVYAWAIIRCQVVRDWHAPTAMDIHASLGIRQRSCHIDLVNDDLT